MSTPILTVVIPTYNRPQHLKNLVQLLLPQRTPRWKLLIVDNHSPTPVRDLVPSDVEVIRNPTNIGSAGNFPRCFEMMATDWVWMIGDDDLVDADAIEHVLAMVNQYPDAAILNFGRHGQSSGRKETLIFHGFSEFLTGSDSITETIWMSANVYSRRHYWPYLGLAYRFANTSSGHYVLLMLALIRGGSFVQLPRAVCRQAVEGVDGGGNHGEFYSTLMALADLPMSREQRHVFARRMQREGLKLSRDVLHCAYQLMHPECRDEILYLFFERWVHWAVVRGSIGLFLIAAIVRLMLGFAPGRMIIRTLARLVVGITGKHVVPRPHVPRFFSAI